MRLELETRLKREPRQGVGQVRGQLRRGHQVAASAIPLAVPELTPSRRGERERARRVVAELPLLDRLQGLLGQSIRGADVSSSGCDQRPLSDCDRVRFRRSYSCGERDRLLEDRVAALHVAQEESRGSLHEQGGGCPRVVLGKAGDGQLGIRLHLDRPLAAESGAHDRDPGLDCGHALAPRRYSALGGVQPAVGVLRPAASGMDAAALDGDRRMTVEPLVDVEQVEPALHDRCPAAVVELQRDRAQDAGGVIDVSGGVGVEEGGFGIEVRLVPGSRPAVEDGHEIGLVLRPALAGARHGRDGGIRYQPRRWSSWTRNRFARLDLLELRAEPLLLSTALQSGAHICSSTEVRRRKRRTAVRGARGTPSRR
jgi:hypothetical protein